MIKKYAALAAVVVLAVQPLAWADDNDYVTKTADGLLQDWVYVDPDAPLATPELEAQITAALYANDNIVVAVLPGNALDETDGNSLKFADAVDKKMNAGTDVMALVIGKRYYASSFTLPLGVPTSSMVNAKSVSTGVGDTLVTFIQNIHQYQRTHGGTKPKPRTAKHDDGGGFLIWGFIVCGLLIAAIPSIWAWMHFEEARSDPERITLKSPDPVRNVLKDLIDLRQKVTDPAVKDSLTQICRDTEAYFKRAVTSGTDVIAFRKHLETLKNVLTRYIDVQENPRYFDDAPDLLKSGASAVSDFSDYVLNSVKRGSRKELTDFHINTDILSAQRYTT